jgi:hypothetical protein
MKSGSTPLKLAVALAIGTAVHAAIPYLPQVGPPPLRFEAVKSPAAAITLLKPSPATPAASVTNKPPVAETAISPVATNLVTVGNQTTATTNTPAEVSTVAAAPAPEASPSLGQIFTSSVFTLPPPDLVGITPQMLVTYFHPVQFGTNSAVVTPFPISFVPPTVPDNKSSHAEYIIK